MAAAGYIRNDLEDVALFVSTDASYSGDKKGTFNFVPNSGTNKYFYATHKIFIAVAGIEPSTVVSSSEIRGGTYTEEQKNYTIITNGTTYYRPQNTTYASYGDVTIIDEHGTHKGTGNCQNKKCYRSSYHGCIGVQHESSDVGWVFKGWRVTGPTSGYEIPSEDYDRTFVNGQYVWEIPNPSEDDLNNALIIYDIDTSGAITVEAIYEELPKWTVSFDLNGGTGDAPSVDTYRGDSITIPDYRPTREGHIFLGWALSSSATTAEYVNGDEFTPDQDVILYAVWEESEEPDEPVTPGGGGSGSTKGFIRRSSTSDYLIFSVATGELVYN